MYTIYYHNSTFTALTVTGLTPGKEYKFRVTAVNAEGESDPLQTAESIIAKNPFGKMFMNFAIVFERVQVQIIIIIILFFFLQMSQVNQVTWK